MSNQESHIEECLSTVLKSREHIFSIMLNLLRIRIGNKDYKENFKKNIDFSRKELTKITSKKIIEKILFSIKSHNLTYPLLSLYISHENKYQNLIDVKFSIFSVDDIMNDDFYND